MIVTQFICIYKINSSKRRLAEQLNSLNISSLSDEMSTTSTKSSTYAKEESEVRLEAEEEDKFLLAKTYFDCHEYDRASMILADSRSARARFLGLYSKFMVQPPSAQVVPKNLLATTGSS